MTVTAPRAPGRGPAQRTTRRAWLALAVFVAVQLVVGVLTFPLLDLLGLAEGDVFLMSRDVAGWAVELGSVVLLAAPAVAGAVLGARAVRQGGGPGAWAALVVSALLLAFVGYGFVDDVRMTYR